MNIEASARKLYNDTFGVSKKFDDKLFDLFFDKCRYITEGDTVISMLFELPCTLVTEKERIPACYIYAAATEPQHQGKGYMTKLVKEACCRHGLIVLRPADESLVDFYGKMGFVKTVAVSREGGPSSYIEAGEKLKELCKNEAATGERFCIMCKGQNSDLLNGVGFAYSMP